MLPMTRMTRMIRMARMTRMLTFQEHRARIPGCTWLHSGGLWQKVHQGPHDLAESCRISLSDFTRILRSSRCFYACAESLVKRPVIWMTIIHMMIQISIVPVVPARSGAEVGYTIRPFSSIELACAVRQPGPCVRALCEAVAQMLSKNMTCAQPRCKATPSEDFPHTSRSTLRTPHFISSQSM